MAKEEKRGFFSFFGRKSTMSGKEGVEESGPSQTPDSAIIRTYSRKWFGGPLSARKPSKEVKDRAAAEPTNAEDVEAVIESTLQETKPTEQGTDPVVFPAEVENQLPVEVKRGFLAWLKKYGIPIGVVVVACVAVKKLTQ